MIAPKPKIKKYGRERMKVMDEYFRIMSDENINPTKVSIELIIWLINSEQNSLSEQRYYEGIIVPKLRKLNPVIDKKGFALLISEINNIFDSGEPLFLKDLLGFINVRQG